MRKSLFITLLSICAATSVNAVMRHITTQSPSSVKNRALECRIRAVDISKDVHGRTAGRQEARRVPLRAAEEDMAGASAKCRLRPLGMDELRRLTAPGNKERLDKVVCTLSSTGEPYSLQEFEFDGHGWPVKRVNSLWDATSQKYNPAEVYGFKWDDDGYCLSQWQTSELYAAGLRYDYRYNDKKLGIEQIYYEYDPSAKDGWASLQKNEYAYDDRGNIIEETIYVYDAASGGWTLAQKNKAAWDGRGFQTLFESYLWNGSAWTGIDEKQEYSWAAEDRMTQCKSYTWQDGQWVWYVNLEQDFDGSLNLTRREKRFYNKELGNWNGCCTWNGSYYENEKSTSVYDAGGHVTAERTYGMPSATGEWMLGAWSDHVWTGMEDGSYRDDYAGYLGDETDYTESYAGTEVFDAEGRQTYILDKMYDYAAQKLLNDYERVTTYNANGDILTEVTYSFDNDEANTRKGELAVYNTYDDKNNIVETVNMMGASGGSKPLGSPAMATAAGDDGVEWENTTRFEYFYEQDTIRVKKLGYRWTGGQWTLNQGEATVYDYDVPAENITAWPGYDTYHKIAQTRSFVTGSADEWYVFDYVYSDIASGISGVTGGKGGVRVWPTVVDDGFNVEASEGARVSVYSMNGTRVATSASGWVSVSGLPSGIYIVSVDGCKTKIIKK